MINNNLSVLPFYAGDTDLQQRNLPYSYGANYPLFTQLGEILPFQIQREHSAGVGISSAIIYDANTGQAVTGDITAAMTTCGLQVVEFANYGIDVIVYNSQTLLAPSLGITPYVGRYYLRIEDGDGLIWYSDVWTWVDSVSPYLHLQWYDEQDLHFDAGIVVYNTPKFINNLYLCTEVGKPEYEFEEEGEQRDGYFFPLRQISAKVYKAVILAPEYLTDVMRLIRMADHIRLTDKYGRVYDCDTFEVDVKWEEQGDLAGVTLTWKTNTIVKKVGVAYNRQLAGDFNIDYNGDYNNT